MIVDSAVGGRDNSWDEDRSDHVSVDQRKVVSFIDLWSRGAKPNLQWDTKPFAAVSIDRSGDLVGCLSLLCSKSDAAPAGLTYDLSSINSPIS